MQYSQHMVGVGHYFRNLHIAQALAKEQDVYFINGGRPIPEAVPSKEINTIQLNPISRDLSTGSHISETPELPIEIVLKNRKDELILNIEKVKPDIFLIEFFPFARWELAPELLPSIQCIKEKNSRAKIVCSLRDITQSSWLLNFNISGTSPPVKYSESWWARTKYLNPFLARDEKIKRQNTIKYYKYVVSSLNDFFDALLIHGDPQVTTLEEHFQWINNLNIPLHYTGYVSERLKEDYDEQYLDNTLQEFKPFVLVSVGGGSEGYELIKACIQAWRNIQPLNALDNYRMVISTGLFISDEEFLALNQYIQSTKGIILKRFIPNFLYWMQAASFSISRAGYNTCMNILESHTPSLLIPSKKIGDQVFRATRFSELGLVQMMDPEEVIPEKIGDMILKGISQPKIVHNIDLDGATKTSELLCNLID